MGVGSLFTYLSLIPNCATIVDLLSFGRGLTIGLDASCWLHALCHNPNVAKQLVFMNRVDALVHGFVERCQRLHEHGIILRVVFDGPAPAGKCSKSARTGRDANSKTLLRIRSQIRSGAAAESIPISDVEKAAGAALKALASTFSPDIAAQLRARGIGMCIRAREEADTQLAMECFCGAEVICVPSCWRFSRISGKIVIAVTSRYAAYSQGKGSSAASSVARAERTTAEVLVAESGSGRAAATAADAAWTSSAA
jgi:hypothetical protein